LKGIIMNISNEEAADFVISRTFDAPRELVTAAI
jgi:hypothetical protein